MGHEPQVEHARLKTFSSPLLFECDTAGVIVWMSEATRAWLGDSANLIQAMAGGNRAPGPAFAPRVYADSLQIRLTRLLEMPRCVLVSAEVTPTVSSVIDGVGLLKLQGTLLHHNIRLERVQRKLAARVRRGRRGKTRRAIELLELERERLGRELHTGVGQALTAIRLNLELIRVRITSPDEAVDRSLTSISNLASDALEEVRAVSHRLQPPEWQGLSLQEALQRMWNRSSIAERYAGTLSLDADAPDPGMAGKVVLYRAAQEALSNLIRHSGATSVHLSLAREGSALVLRVEDNGHGFNGSHASGVAGIGLRSLRAQVAEVGGDVQIESGVSGTSLRITVPLAKAENQ